jgi:energy-coupling factor transporter transmembrane protein EcfT
VPGSPRSDAASDPFQRITRLHPAALLAAAMAVGAGLALARVWWILAAASLAFLLLARRAERRPLRAELPFLGLAAVVLAAHTAAAGAGWREALASAAAIAFRLLALAYLVRWAARAFLGRASRWLLGLTPPRRPRLLTTLVESGRLTMSLLPLALREAEQHALALRARGIRPGRGAAGRARFIAAWFLPFLGTMLRSSDAFADALQTRGYAIGAPRRGGLVLAWGVGEWSLIGGAGLLAWGLARGV